MRISAREGALTEQSSIYLTCLNKSAVPLCAVLWEKSALSQKINNYWEQLCSLCVNVSVFASVSFSGWMFASPLLCSLLVCELVALEASTYFALYLPYACDTDRPLCFCWNLRVPIMLWVNVVTMSLDQYALVSPYSSNRALHHQTLASCWEVL